MEEKVVVVLVLGLLTLAIAGAYLLVIKPQQDLAYQQLLLAQQSAQQQAQFQQMVSLCNSQGLQYNIVKGGCEEKPLLYSLVNNLDNNLNPLNPASVVSQTIKGFLDTINPLSPTSVWTKLFNSAKSVLFGG